MDSESYRNQEPAYCQEETAVSMAAKAAKRALEDAQVAAEEIDLLLVSSVSSEQLCHVQPAVFKRRLVL